jgi:hypothetical protein
LGKRRSGKKALTPSPEELASLWEVANGDGPDAEEADLLFEEAVRSLIRDRALDRPLLSGLLARLPPDQHHPLLHLCEELAAEETGWSPRMGDPHSLFQLFIIPVHGDLADVAAALDDPELLDGLARALRRTGYAIPDSNVFVRPDLFPVQALALLGPDRIRDLLLDGVAVLGRKPETGATLQLLQEAADLIGPPRQSGPEEVTFGVRFLIGTRMSLDRGDLADGLLPDPEETEEELLDRVESWRDESEGLLAGFGAITFEPPTPWGEARVELLTCALRQLADLALEAEGVDLIGSPYPEISSHLQLTPEDLVVELFRDGSPLTGITMSGALIGPALGDLIEAISEEFPPTLEEPAAMRALVH